MSPLVSIVIPVYNAEKYLAECLESVCNQTLVDIEIICVDDGSTDGSASLLDDYAKKDERIHVISQTNGGELAARNSGIQLASGQWIGFVDSDDRVSADMFERLLGNGEKHQADISHCGLLFFYTDGREIPHFGTGIVKLQDHDTGLIDILNGSQIEPSMCNKLYRRELFNDFNIAERIQHNGDLYCNFILFGKASSAIYEDFCGYHYRRYADSVSGDFEAVDSLRDILSVRHELLDMSSPPVQAAAYTLWLSTLVNIINRVSYRADEESGTFYKECMEQLKHEKHNLSCLSQKQQIIAKMHLRMPKTARLIYRAYGKYSLYRYEH